MYDVLDSNSSELNIYTHISQDEYELCTNTKILTKWLCVYLAGYLWLFCLCVLCVNRTTTKTIDFSE